MELYELWKPLMRDGTASFWQEFYVKFYQAFIEGSRWKQYLNGVGTTLLVTAMALTLGILLGIVVAVIRTAHDQQRTGHKNPILGLFNGICKVYVTVIRGTPVVVQLLISFFIVFTWAKDGTWVATITFGINSGAYVAEVIRSGIMAIDRGQMEAGRSLGLTQYMTMKEIILPQAFKNILPAIGNEMIALLKETSVAGYVAVVDLTKAGNQIKNTTYDQTNPILLVALVYLLIVILMTKLLGIMERRLRKSDNR